MSEDAHDDRAALGEDSDSEAEQRRQVLLGRMGLAGAVLVALISLAGVFLGSLVQSRSNSATTGEQIRQADAAYIRAQRKEAYVDFLTANRKLLAAEDDVLRPDPDLPPGDRTYADLLWREYLLAIDVIQIVGPDELLKNVDGLRQSHVAMRDEISRAPQRPAKPAEKQLYNFQYTCVNVTSNDVASDLRHALEATEDRAETVKLDKCWKEDPPK